MTDKAIVVDDFRHSYLLVHGITEVNLRIGVEMVNETL
jgi:hypothetical protein